MENEEPLVIERQPIGVPAGGQFAETRKAEPLTSLGGAISDADYNSDGSWQFPPRPRSAAQHVAFWASTRIPDEVLANMSIGFYNRNIDLLTAHNAEIQAKFESIWRPQARNLVFRKDSKDEIEAEGERKRVMYEDFIDSVAPEYLGDTPLRIDPTDARTIARAAFMFDGAMNLNRQFTVKEQQAVFNFPVELSTGETTVEGVEDTYRLWAMRDIIQRPAMTTADVVRKLMILEQAIDDGFGITE